MDYKHLGTIFFSCILIFVLMRSHFDNDELAEMETALQKSKILGMCRYVVDVCRETVYWWWWPDDKI